LTDPSRQRRHVALSAHAVVGLAAAAKRALEFICQLGTVETRAVIDAQLILDAAQRSIRVWPADQG
jgi:hypothetical protein